MAITAHLFNYICVQQGHHYDAPAIPDFSYGEFVMRSKSGRYSVYLNALADPVFDEVAGIVKASQLAGNLSDLQITDVQQKAFGIACDPSPDGSPFQIGKPPQCPICGSNPSESSIAMPEVMVDLPVPTHDDWNRLSEREKVERVEKFITSL